ncbi:C2H2-type domain-containing protein [Psidium guajava]|nr:C2H2-type domain-containing protein [Psidium guajava]
MASFGSSPSPSFFSQFRCLLLLLLLHLGCFIFSPSSYATAKQRKASPTASHFKPRKALSSSWSYLKRVFISKPRTSQTPTSPLSSARNSQRSIASLVPPPEVQAQAQAFEELTSTRPRERPGPGTLLLEEPDRADLFFPLRNDAIFPCTSCGEVFPKSQLLEQHHATRHAVSELVGEDSGRNIVQIIFQTGWPAGRGLRVLRILKIHHGPRALSRFEEYRESVKMRAARAARRRDERCVADGNELLRFHCSTFTCDLGRDGDSSICDQQFCNVCGIIKSGFSKKLDGISTLSSGWRAHGTLPDEVVEEFGFMHVKRAMLVCRVVAGRVGCETDEADKEEGGGFDSVVGRGGSGALARLDDEDLLVFNPRAVLPCFVIVYTA